MLDQSVLDSNRCPICGANTNLVGKSHRCVPKSGGVVESRHEPPIGDGYALAEPTLKSRLAGVASSPPDAKRKRAPRGTFDKNAYQREYMRKWRAKKKA